MGMKTPCLGAHSGSLNKTLVARTRDLGALGDRAPVRQQPCICHRVLPLKRKVITLELRHIEVNTSYRATTVLLAKT